jgi:hypothetical protein
MTAPCGGCAVWKQRYAEQRAQLLRMGEQLGAARLALATLESERAANALLTEELDLTRLGK